MLWGWGQMQAPCLLNHGGAAIWTMGACVVYPRCMLMHACAASLTSVLFEQDAVRHFDTEAAHALLKQTPHRLAPPRAHLLYGAVEIPLFLADSFLLHCLCRGDRVRATLRRILRLGMSADFRSEI